MALTIALDGYGEVATSLNTPADSNWLIDASGGIGIATDGDSTLTGNFSLSASASGNKFAHIYYDINGADRSLDFTPSTGTEAGQHIYVWFNCTSIGAADAIADPGVSIRVGSGNQPTSNFREYVLGGNDLFANEYTGGWQCAVIDPTKASTSGAGAGTFTLSDVRTIGVYYGGNLTSRADNIFIDSIQCAKGLIVTGTETTSGEGWQEIVNYCTDLSNRAWGVVQEKDGIIFVYGNITIGGTVATTFTNSGKVIKFGNYEYWSGSGTTFNTSISDGFHGLTITDNGTAVTQFVDGVEVGSSGAGRSGSTYLGSDNNTTVISLRGTTTTSYTSLYNTKFDNCTGTVSGSSNWGDSANDEMYSCTISKSGQFSPNGSVDIRGCFFTETVSTSASLLWTANINIQNCNFIGNTTGAGVEIATDHGSDGEEAFVNLQFSGNTNDVNNTTGASLNVLNNGTSNPTTSTGSSVTFVSSKLLTITNVVTGSEVRLYSYSNIESPENYTELAGVETASNGVSGTFTSCVGDANTVTLTYAYDASGGDVDALLVVHDLNYEFFRIELTLDAAENTSTRVFQISDRQYDAGSS